MSSEYAPTCCKHSKLNCSSSSSAQAIFLTLAALDTGSLVRHIRAPAAGSQVSHTQGDTRAPSLGAHRAAQGGFRDQPSTQAAQVSWRQIFHLSHILS